MHFIYDRKSKDSKNSQFLQIIYSFLISLLLSLLGVAIRRVFGSDADSDSYKNPFKKNPDFPRISDS